MLKKQLNFMLGNFPARIFHDKQDIIFMKSGQIIATSADVTSNGGLVRESFQNPLNSGLGIKVICPDEMFEPQPSEMGPLTGEYLFILAIDFGSLIIAMS